MAHNTLNEPKYDFDSLRKELDAWKANGVTQVIAEWNTGPGPTVFCYPAGQRQFGFRWRAEVAPTHYNEQYADFLEYRLGPQIRELVQSRSMKATVLCVDQQPIQVMRMRRRAIELAESAAAAR